MPAKKGNNREGEIEAPKSLTTRASLGAISNALQYVVRLIVGLIITPIIVGDLGKELYGAWMMIQQTVGYVALADLRPTSTVKFTLAVHQHEEDFRYKKQQVGASLLALGWVIPLVLGLGAIVVWIAPQFIRTNPEYFSHIRWALGIGTVGILVGELSSVPGNVLRGVNLEYKAMGLNALVTALTSSIAVVAICMGWGLIGLACAGIVGLLVTGTVRYFVARTNIPWFGVEWPPPEVLQRFWRQTVWIFLASMGFVLQNSSDLLVVGAVLGPSAAAVYGITGTVLRMGTQPIYALIGAANPGIAGLCGQREWKRVEQVRNEIHLVGLFITVVLGAGFLALNEAFINLWLGSTYYGGDLLNLLLVVIALQSIPLRLDTMMMDGMLKFRERAIATIATSILALVLGAILAQLYGMEGMAVGIIIGRLLAMVLYPMIIKSGSGIGMRAYIRWMARPCVVGMGLLVLSYFASFGRLGIVEFIGAAVGMGVGVIFIMWFLGLSQNHRNMLEQRFSSQLSVISGYIGRSRTATL